HDFRVTARGLQQCVEVLNRASVGHPHGKLVESIEQQCDPACAQHVRECLEIDEALAGGCQMLRNELLQRACLLQGAQLYQHGHEVRDLLGHMPSELTQQEGLAGAEAAQHEHEARSRL